MSEETFKAVIYVHRIWFLAYAFSMLMFYFGCK